MVCFMLCLCVVGRLVLCMYCKFLILITCKIKVSIKVSLPKYGK